MPVEINVGSHKIFEKIRDKYHPPKEHTNFWKVRDARPLNSGDTLMLAENVKRYAVPAGCWYIWDNRCVHAHVNNATPYVLFAAYMGMQYRTPELQAKRDLWWQEHTGMTEKQDIQRAYREGDAPYAYFSGGSEASGWHNIVWWKPYAWRSFAQKHENPWVKSVKKVGSHPWFGTEMKSKPDGTLREVLTQKPNVVQTAAGVRPYNGTIDRPLNGYGKMLLGMPTDGTDTEGKTSTNVCVDINRIWGGPPLIGEEEGAHLDCDPYCAQIPVVNYNIDINDGMGGSAAMGGAAAGSMDVDDDRIGSSAAMGGRVAREDEQDGEDMTAFLKHVIKLHAQWVRSLGDDGLQEHCLQALSDRRGGVWWPTWYVMLTLDGNEDSVNTILRALKDNETFMNALDKIARGDIVTSSDVFNTIVKQEVLKYARCDENLLKQTFWLQHYDQIDSQSKTIYAGLIQNRRNEIDLFCWREYNSIEIL